MKKSIYTTLIAVLILSFNVANSQEHSTIKKYAEWQAQRFLFDKLYKVSDNEVERVSIDKTIQDIDYGDGFGFIMTSYVYKEKSGAVFTSYNSMPSNQKTEYFDNAYNKFTNIHLTEEEVFRFFNIILELRDNAKKMDLTNDDHLLKKFNDRIVIDIAVKDDGGLNGQFWIDNYSRHDMYFTKVKLTIDKYERFLKKNK